MKNIEDFEIVDHGIEHEQYFQGCGIFPTEFTDIASGIGNNPAEAIDDALEHLASNDWETEGMENRICEYFQIKKIPTTPEVEYDESDEDYSDGVHYYISIRVK